MASAHRDKKVVTLTAHADRAEKLCQAGVIGLLSLTAVLGVSGCHGGPFESPAPPLGDAQFMDAWKTYLHCRSSTEPDEIRSDLHQLEGVAQALSTQEEPSALLPAAIQSLIAAPPSRLAVDPNAMVIACAQRGALVAQSAGRSE